MNSLNDNFSLEDETQNDVLLDFTTLSTVNDILDGQSSIKSPHIFDLATFLEAVILHDRIIVLSETGYGIGDIIGRRPLEKLESYKDLNKLLYEKKQTFCTIDEFLNPQKATFCQNILPELGRFSEMKTLYEEQFQPTTRLNKSNVLRNLEISENDYPSIAQYYRTNMYWDCAIENELIYKPHSLRMPFLANLISFEEYRNQSMVDYIIKKMHISIEKENKRYWNTWGKGYRLTLPMMIRLVLHESESVDDIIENALELRKQAEDFRKWCREFNNTLYGEGDIEEYISDLYTILPDVFPESKIMSDVSSKNNINDTYKIRRTPRWLRYPQLNELDQGVEGIEDTLKRELFRNDLAFLLDVNARACGIITSRKDYLKIFKQKPPKDILQFANELNYIIPHKEGHNFNEIEKNATLIIDFLKTVKENGDGIISTINIGTLITGDGNNLSNTSSYAISGKMNLNVENKDEIEKLLHEFLNNLNKTDYLDKYEKMDLIRDTDDIITELSKKPEDQSSGRINFSMKKIWRTVKDIATVSDSVVSIAKALGITL